MLKNSYFEISALIILTVFLPLINIKKTIRSSGNRFFICFAVLSVINIVLDILFTVIITYPNLFDEWFNMISLVALRVFEITLPFLLYIYVLALRGSLNRSKRTEIILMSIPFAGMLLVVLTNPFTDILFYFDKSKNYITGDLFSMLYVYSLYYIVISLASTVIHRRKIKRKKIQAVWLVAFFSTLAVVCQILFDGILFLGLGIAVSVIVLVLTIQNPNDRIDNLTGVFEASGLVDVLTICRQKKQKIWMIAIALDNLRRINHVFGMKWGDELVIDVSDKLKRIAGEKHTFRLTGDKFAIILYSEKSYFSSLNQINEYFRTKKTINSIDIRLSSCVCGFPLVGSCGKADEVLALMDYTITLAKKVGPGTVLFANESIISQFKRNRQIEEYLYTAVEKKLFDVHYQPVYSTVEERFVTAEALVRLTHPTMGPISPAEFIPIAESSGQINAIDQLVFEKTCQFLSKNPEVMNAISSIKLNISPADFIDESLSREMLHIIRKYKLPPDFFHFEITETAATVYGNELSVWVSDIKRSGAGLCLDDFGSGYANLDSVAKLPFDVVKIDRSMLTAAMQSINGEILYGSVFGAMSALGLKVVAEGAETIQQIDYLKGLGVDFIQGFYYSKPLCELDFLNLLTHKRELVGCL